METGEIQAYTRLRGSDCMLSYTLLKDILLLNNVRNDIKLNCKF